MDKATDDVNGIKLGQLLGKFNDKEKTDENSKQIYTKGLKSAEKFNKAVDASS